MPATLTTRPLSNLTCNRQSILDSRSNLTIKLYNRNQAVTQLTLNYSQLLRPVSTTGENSSQKNSGRI
jgi:hypothetical protein